MTAMKPSPMEASVLNASATLISGFVMNKYIPNRLTKPRIYAITAIFPEGLAAFVFFANTAFSIKRPTAVISAQARATRSTADRLCSITVPGSLTGVVSVNINHSSEKVTSFKVWPAK